MDIETPCYVHDLEYGEIASSVKPEVLFLIEKNKKELEREILLNRIGIIGVIFFIAMVVSSFLPIDF